MWPSGSSQPLLLLELLACFLACCFIGFAIPSIDKRHWRDASSALKTAATGWKRMHATVAAMLYSVSTIWRH